MHEPPTPSESDLLVVVIAEDEEPIAEALSFIVEDYGLTPVVAAHGKHALELIHRHSPVLLITDLMMPVMTGRQLIAAVRAEASAGHSQPLPIVLMSAASGLYTRDTGADAILRKPFDITQVEDLLRRFVPRPKAN